MSKKTLTRIAESWRVWAAFVYFGICLFDLVIMPGWVEQSNRRLSAQQAVVQSLLFPVDAQGTVLTSLLTERRWEPLTAVGGGVFHLSFGAILGATAFNKYKEDAVAESVASEPVDESDNGPVG